MQNWQFFAGLYRDITGLATAGTNGILNGALGYVRPVLLVAITAWIAAQAITVSLGQASMRSLYGGIIRGAVVVFLLQGAATYNQYVGTVAQAIPQEVSNAITPGAVGNIGGGVAFDNVWNAAAKAGIAVWESIPSYSIKGAMLFLLVGVYFIATLCFIGAGFLVYLASTVLLQLLLAVGPLFVALFAFPQTHKFAAGWVAAVVSTLLTQILAVAILVMFTAAEQATVARIAAPGPGGVGNFIDPLFTLLEASVLLYIIYKLVHQAPTIAASVSGGVYQGVGSLLASAGKAVGTAASATTQGIAKAAQGVGAATIPATRIIAATGRSLSGAARNVRFTP